MQQSNIRTPVLLYRHLLKCIRQLPSETQGHYKHHVRQGYASHCDETDPVRIQQIINRAVQDAEWLVTKGNLRDLSQRIPCNDRTLVQEVIASKPQQVDGTNVNKSQEA